MRKTRLLLVLMLVWSSSSAMTCTKTDDRDINNFITLPGPTGPSGSLPSNCAPVDRVRIVEAPGSLLVGQKHAIDVTPKDSFGQNRPDACNEASGNEWTVSDSEVCSVDSPRSFLTAVQGKKAGDCGLTATVAGKSDTVTFRVN